MFKNVSEIDAPSKFFFSLEQNNGQEISESRKFVSEPTEILSDSTQNFIAVSGQWHRQERSASSMANRKSNGSETGM